MLEFEFWSRDGYFGGENVRLAWVIVWRIPQGGATEAQVSGGALVCRFKARWRHSAVSVMICGSRPLPWN